MEVHCFRTFNDVICRSNPTLEECPEFVPIEIVQIFIDRRAKVLVFVKTGMGKEVNSTQLTLSRGIQGGTGNWRGCDKHKPARLFVARLYFFFLG